MRRKIKTTEILYFFLIAGLGFCVGIITTRYFYRNTSDKTEAFICGYIAAFKNIEDGNFDVLNDTIIILHPKKDNVNIFVKNNRGE